jgi:hypothetical protein
LIHVNTASSKNRNAVMAVKNCAVNANFQRTRLSGGKRFE